MFKKYFLYKHTNKINGKVYVGQTLKLPEERWKANGKGYTDNKEFYNDIQKYGWDNFKHEILAENLCKKEVDFMEKTLIACLNLTNPEKGYNKSPGIGGITQETIEKIRKSNIGKKRPAETCKRISESKKGRIPWNKGKKNIYSEETLKKISEKKKGQIPPNKGKKMSKEKCKETMFKKGSTPWNKGLPMSEETRKKVIEGVKKHPSKGFSGGHHSEEMKEKARQRMLGKKLSEETRKKMSETNKQRWLKIKKGV